MIDLFYVAQVTPFAAPSVWPAVIGSVAVLLTLLGLAWRAGRTLATKSDLEKLQNETKSDLEKLQNENYKSHAAITDNIKENRRQFQAVSGTLNSVQHDVAFIAGRQYERDHRQPSPTSESTSSYADDRTNRTKH